MGLSRNCRLCGKPYSEEPALRLHNVPRGVQVFPSAEQLDSDIGVNLGVYQCEHCGLVQLAGEPVVYDDQVTSASSYSSSLLAHRKDQAAKFVNDLGLVGKSVLDVGCGEGHFLTLLAKSGALAYGVEPSHKSVQLARGKALQVSQGFVNAESKVSDRLFDAFVTLHTLEHVPNPNDFLQGIRNNLTARAVGLIEVPSLEQSLEKQRYYDFVADHLSYFSTETLRLLLETNGFRVSNIYRDWEGEHLVAQVQVSSKIDFNPLWTASAELCDQLTKFLQGNLAAKRRVAVWGASYQALSVLALCRVEGITCVIDSASYKHDHFTPVSHIPILAPDVLGDNSIDTVIVMAPRHSNEIIKQLQTEWGFRGEIAVLDGPRITTLVST